ncbi:MAG TPA: RNA 3'-terminal phosphate cyclase, partial [Patescibacteria group bacterium]|nr:RNA 3'-terminal phosphate cyclase [Patescibacteria group bacterium]
MLEGGGQILRMATSFSALLGEPVRVRKIRAGRSRPGLQPQHLMTLRAASEMCDAETEGVRAGSQEIVFRPGNLRGGSYKFDIGTAGSISLLLQCVTPIAAFAGVPVRLRVKGGTAVRWSPPIMFLDRVTWGALRLMGFTAELEVLREGFYPRGGGIVDVKFKSTSSLRALIAETPDEVTVEGVSVCGRLPRHVAERQASSARGLLKELGYEASISTLERRGDEAPLSPGSFICLWVASGVRAFIGSSALGEWGKPAERVGEEAASALLGEISSRCAVDRYTADNLILWCSLAHGTSSFTTSKFTAHTRT